MRIKKLKVENFRNLENLDIEFSEGVNIIYGNNAQGKTNIIEAIYIFSFGKTFLISFKTVSPPIPESNTPIDIYFFSLFYFFCKIEN